MKRLITALITLAMLTYAVLFAYFASAELLDAVIRVPQDLDTSAREPVIDPATGAQATVPGSGELDEEGNIIPGTEELVWGDYLIGSGVAYELYRVDAEWADGGISPGTIKINPYKIIVSSLDVDGDAPAAMLDLIFVAYGLIDWELIGLKTFIPAPAVWDNTDPEKPVLKTPATDKYYRVPTEAEIFPYLNDRPIMDCSVDPCVQTGVQAKNCNWLPMWGNAKYLPWQCK